MNKNLPDKWVRKAVKLAVNNIVVNGKTIPCFDNRVTGRTIPLHYILMTTQTADENKATKCESRWEASILIDVVTTFKGTANVGSRNLVDDIMDSVRNLTKALVLDGASGLVIRNQTQDFPADITSITKTQNIFRKLMRIEMTIN